MNQPPSVLLVLHDVAPQTWPDYQPFVEAVDALGQVPMTWLVVPDFHRTNDLEAHPGFRRLLDSRVERGDELVLHGYYHCDDGPVALHPKDWFMRRVYTHEGSSTICPRRRPSPACAPVSKPSSATTGRWKVSSPRPG